MSEWFPIALLLVANIWAAGAVITATFVAWFMVAMFGEAVNAGHERWGAGVFFQIAAVSVFAGGRWPFLLWRMRNKSG